MNARGLRTLLLAATILLSFCSASLADPPVAEPSLRAMLDAPLLFTKQHPYFAGHIYDDYITWHPGGGIYVIENPWDAPEKHRVRAVIDPTTDETLGEGVYRDPELSWDAKRLVFAFKGEANGSTSLYEIGIDGKGLRRLTNPGDDCGCACGAADQPTRIGGGHHDIMPCYLPDGRIVFSSTRPKSLVPCFNSSVNTLHIMDADGRNIRTLSVNNVTEFDPSILPDGRILFGRWEYIDKTALYMQSLWTMLPDGRMEEAYFANNMAKPTALLDARAVPGTSMVVASLTPHNGQAVGAIGMIDMQRGKNALGAITNFTPELPTEMDQGVTRGPCDPWPLSADVLLMANNAGGDGVIQIVHRDGRRELVHAAPGISCYAPMLVKPRSKPAEVAKHVDAQSPTGAFVVADVYEGLLGVPRGTIKRLRVVEETARVSDIPPGGRWWNQAFLISWQGAYIVKNILGTVPVHEDGSAHFDVPVGRAVYFQALDAEGREVQRMRTFVQAAPGTTRTCVGCHEHKQTAPPRLGEFPLALRDGPARLQPESWGSGYIDYPTMVQPVLDEHCVRCHGGEEGMDKGLDFSGGWTWAFNISYETLIKHRMVGYLNCENGSMHTATILPPRTIGSGGAPLAERLIEKHPNMPRAHRDLLFAWMDTNSNYYGTWDYSPHATCDAIIEAAPALAHAMREAGCGECHAAGHIGNDWINLEKPEFSRILRAPLGKSAALGLAFCRDRKAQAGYPLVDQRVQPPDVVRPSRQPEWDQSGTERVTFTSTDDPRYQALLAVIRHARGEALMRPRIDMPGAEIHPGRIRAMSPPGVPRAAPSLAVRERADGAVELTWPLTAETIGLTFEVHRGAGADFAPNAQTLLTETTAGRCIDSTASSGTMHYALIAASTERRSTPSRASLDVAAPQPVAVPSHLTARAISGAIDLSWQPAEGMGLRYDVYRAKTGGAGAKLNAQPLARLRYRDAAIEPNAHYVYSVAAIDRFGRDGPRSPVATAVALPERIEPVFALDLRGPAPRASVEDEPVAVKLHGGAKLAEGAIDLRSGGFASVAHAPAFDLGHALSVECWLRLDEERQMPVVLSCGVYNQQGWFLQRIGRGWRWHLGGVSCDGGQPAVGRWVHLAATFDGSEARLYQNGKQVAVVPAAANLEPWAGPLVIGQYGSQADSYQVLGQIKGVKIYRRALAADEIAAAFKAAAALEPPASR
jgi:hypothetical protein